MMKQLLLAVVLCTSLSVAARDFTYDGIKYTVIDEVNKYVETKAGYSEDIDDKTNYYAGNDVVYYKLDLPAKVYDGDVEYTLTRIGDISFTGAIIYKLSLPETVTEIGYKGFSVCTRLTEVKLPKEMASLGEEAFSGCSSLADIELPNIDIIKSMTFALCLSLEHITIPESVTTIETNAFTMSALKSISIPNVSKIEGMAFWLCVNLKTVKLGNALTDLGINSFSGCPIAKLYYNTDSPVITFKSTFDDEVYENATMYVPISSKSKFETTTPWSYFTKIEELDFAGVDSISAMSDPVKCEYYDLNGCRIINPTSGQIVIKRLGRNTCKMVMP